MTDNEIKRAIRKTEPRLNANAIKRMLFNFKWGALPGNKTVPMPTNDVEMAARVRVWIKDEQQENDKFDKAFNLKHPSSHRKTDAVELINENADEAAWEARVS